MASSPHFSTPASSFADPISSPPSPHNGPTVVIVVFVSLGCVFFLAFCLFALWFLISKRKKKVVQEIDIIHSDKHLKVKEDIVEGPHGPQAAVLSIEEDKRFEEEIIKNEKQQLEGKLMQGKAGEITTTDLEGGESSSNPRVQHTSHHVEYKS
ncbi:hypothetical protein Pfo_017172 [Paulownia fortunei]|nr:hypothetical protein Pfo_017172 [Paulownia fortunei]